MYESPLPGSSLGLWVEGMGLGEVDGLPRGGAEDTDMRFWRLIDPDDETKFFYVDQDDIEAAGFNPGDEEEPAHYFIDLKSGNSMSIVDDDGKRLMAWADGLSESLPEVEASMSAGRWKE